MDRIATKTLSATNSLVDGRRLFMMNLAQIIHGACRTIGASNTDVFGLSNRDGPATILIAGNYGGGSIRSYLGSRKGERFLAPLEMTVMEDCHLDRREILAKLNHYQEYASLD